MPDAEGNDSDLSAYFLCANRNKKSIAIDITSEEGVALLRRLVAISDVVVENYKPGDLTRRGLGYEDLRLIKPTSYGARFQALARRVPIRRGLATTS